MNLPERIRVGYRDYAVVAWDALEAQASCRLGESDHYALIIRVHAGLKPQVAAEVLLHEIMHCCWWAGDIHADDGEERTVTVLATQLTQVWRDNPGFVAFMAGALEE